MTNPKYGILAWVDVKAVYGPIRSVLVTQRTFVDEGHVLRGINGNWRYGRSEWLYKVSEDPENCWHTEDIVFPHDPPADESWHSMRERLNAGEVIV